jgi:flagellar protein FliO/FliZ
MVRIVSGVNYEFFGSLAKILVFLPLVILLAYLSIRVGGSKMLKMGQGKIIRVIEKVPLNNKAALSVVLINNKPYVVSYSEDEVKILMPLPEDCVEKQQEENKSFSENMKNNFKSIVKRKERL